MSAPSSSRRPRCLPRLEALEDRLAPATFSVTNTNNSGAGSLRQAILRAKASPGADAITFAISGGGVHVILPTSPLPAVTGPVAIRGAYAAMPRGRGWPRPGRFPISVRYGTPIRPNPDEAFRSVSSRISVAVARLWDEDRTDWYRSLRREAEGVTPSPSGPQAARWRRIWESSRPLPGRERRRAWAPRPRAS